MKLINKLSALAAIASLAHPLAGVEYNFNALQPETFDGSSLSYRDDLNYNNDPSSRWFSFEALDGSTDGALILGYENRGVLSTATITDFTGLEVVYNEGSASIVQQATVVGLGDAETLSGVSYRWQKLTNNNSAAPNLKFEIWGLNGVNNAATFLGSLVYNSPQNNSAAVGTWVEETNIENTPRWWATGTLQTYDQTLAEAIAAARTKRGFPTGTVVVLSAQVAVGSTGGGSSTDLIQGAVDNLSFSIAGGNNDGSYAVNFTGTEGLSAYQSIQAAIDAATPGDTILLKSGTWYENVNVNKSVTIKAAAGAEATIQALNGLGDTFNITANEVTIEGLTIIGGDWGSPGLEKAAVYLATATTDVRILNNEIIAAGEAALLTNWGHPQPGLIVSGNTFGGKTFIGETPATGNQFTVPNVARQLIAIQARENGSDIEFSNNIVSGQSGANGVGNTLATIDGVNSVITGNTFNGEASGSGVLLRARFASSIQGNTFDSSNLSGDAQVAYIENNIIPQFLAENDFDKAAFSATVDGEIIESTLPYVFASLNDAITASTSGSVIGAKGDFVENVNIPADKTILLAGFSQGPEAPPSASITGTAVANVPTLFIRSDNSAVYNMEINRSPVANAQNAVVFLGNATEGVEIAGNVFNSSGPIIEAQGANTVDLSIISNTFNASADPQGGFVRGIYINGGYVGPGNLNGPAQGVYIADNVFTGAFGISSVIAVEGEAQVSGNDFTGVTSAAAIVGGQVGPVVVDGNCFADTTDLLLSGTNTTIEGAYNYFGRSGGPVETNYDGDVTVEPYLTQCDAVYIEAIQAPSGTISPAFAYTNASEAPVFTITPNAGAVLQDVVIGELEDGELVNPTSVGSVTTYTFANNIEGDRAITAEFNSNAAVITSSVSGGNGTLTPVGTFTLAAGGSKSFIAVPDTGYNLVVNYEGNGTVTQGAGGLITVSNITGTENELTVSFVAEGYTVSVTKSGRYAAVLTVDPAGPITDVTSSDSTVFTVTFPANAAAAGVVVTHVKVNGVIQSLPGGFIASGGTYTLSGVTKNTTVEFATGRQ